MSAQILPASNPANILAVARLISGSGIAVVPTDTVYGLAGSVFRPGAVERVFRAKRRDPEVRVPILLGTAADLPLLVRRVPRPAWHLMEVFWPGPLTLVLPASPAAPRTITRNADTVAVRVPGARACLQLLQACGEPLIGTSANISGCPPASTAAEAQAQLGDSVDLILSDDQAVRSGLPSTVLEVTENQAIVHRAGAVSMEDIRHVLGPGLRLTIG
jgi:L-threonylcarbamoyladenylate synthase